MWFMHLADMQIADAHIMQLSILRPSSTRAEMEYAVRNSENASLSLRTIEN